MKCLSALLLVVTLLCARAAAPPPASSSAGPGLQPAPDGGRFLFVVDTSQAMRSMSEVSRQAVFEMIFTGLAGHMRSGDTFGLWTFDDEVQAGEFPMQVWDAQNPLDTASRAALFLHDRKCSGNARMDLLAEKLRVVMKIAVDVTIFVVTAGETPFQGTPFDESINAEYDMRGKERRRLKKPFVTALVARGGQVNSARVTIIGEPLTLPDRPVAARPLTNSVPTRAVSATAASNAVARAATPAVQGSVPSMPAATVAVQTAATVSETPASPVDPATAPELQTPPVTAPPAPPRPKVMQFVARSNVPPRSETVVAGNPVPAAPTNTMASATEPPANPAPPATRAEVSVPPEAPVASAPSSARVSPRADFLGASPAPLPVAAREATPDPAPPPAVAVVAPTSAGLSAPVLLTIGSVLLAAVLFLLIIVLHRLRAEPRPSFITQSMERRQV